MPGGTKFMHAMCLLLFAGLIYVAFTQKLHGKLELREFDKSATIPLRGILASLVVIGHLDTSTDSQFLLLRVFHWATPAVSVFFFMSGYGYEKSIMIKGKKYLQGLFRRTLVKLLIPFVLCVIIHHFICYMTGNFNLGQLPEKLKHGEFGIILPHCWYVFALIIATVAFIYLYKYNLGMWYFAIIYYVIMRYVFCFQFNWWWTILAFPIGVDFARHEETIKKLIINYPKIIFCSSLGLYAFSSYVSFYILSPRIPFFYELPFLLLGPCVVLIMYLWRIPYLGWLGKVSYEIYLTHGIFRLAYLKFCFSPLIYVIMVACSTLVLSYMLYWLSKKMEKQFLILMPNA